jgi:hypothetical protein
VDPMIATSRKERHQLWKYIEKFEREILISQEEEATLEPSEAIWQTFLPFPSLKMYDRPACH